MATDNITSKNKMKQIIVFRDKHANNCVNCGLVDDGTGQWQIVGRKSPFAKEHKVSGKFCASCREQLNDPVFLSKIRTIQTLTKEIL